MEKFFLKQFCWKFLLKICIYLVILSINLFKNFNEARFYQEGTYVKVFFLILAV